MHNRFITWQLVLGLFISTLLIGVFPFLLFYFNCIGNICNFILWIFGVIIVLFGIPTLIASMLLCIFCITDAIKTKYDTIDDPSNTIN